MTFLRNFGKILFLNLTIIAGTIYLLASYKNENPRRATAWFDKAEARPPPKYTCNMTETDRVQVSLKYLWLEERYRPLQYKMYLHPPGTDVFVSDSFRAEQGNQGFESSMKESFYGRLRPRGTAAPNNPLIVDIGANIGTKLGIAFEPLASNYRVLECSAKANPQLNEKLYINNFGLSDKKKDMCMDRDPTNQGHAFVTESSQCDNKMHFNILDDYWKNELKGEQIYILKVDVEGYEPAVFLGAKEMMKKAPPVYIYTEYTPFASKTFGYDPVDHLRFLKNHGYTILYNDKEITEQIPESGNNSDVGMPIELNRLYDLTLYHQPSLDAWGKGIIKF